MREFIGYIDFVEMFALLFIVEMAFIFPIMGIEMGYANITVNRYAFFRHMMILFACEMLVFLLIQAIVKKSYKSLFGKNFKDTVNHWKTAIKMGWHQFYNSFNAIDVAVLLYLGCVLISALLADNRSLAFNGYDDRNNGFWIQLCYVIVYFIVSRSLRMQKLALYLYCLGGTVVSTFLLLHHYGYDWLNVKYPASPDFVGPIGNIDFTSYILTITVVLAAAIYVTEQYVSIDDNGYVMLGCFAVSFWAQLRVDVDSGKVADAAALLVAFLLLLTSSRRVGRMLTLLSVGMGTAIFKRMVMDCEKFEEDFGSKGWLMLALELVLIALTICVNEGKIKLNFSPKGLRIAIASVCGVAVIGVLAAAYRATSGLLYEIGQVVFHHNLADSFGSSRGFLWKRGIKLIKVHPFFGTGPDSFEDVFMSTFQEDMSLDPYFYNRNVAEAHNEFLQLAICSGLLALGSYLAFLGQLVVKGCRGADKNPVLACCVVGVVAYAAHAFFVLALPLHTPLMWVLLGITGSILRSDKQKFAHTILAQ